MSLLYTNIQKIFSENHLADNDILIERKTMIFDILLTSENTVRNTSFIDNNVASKYLLSSIREAQEVHYQEIVGKSMLDKLKTLVQTETIDAEGNEPYKNLLNESQKFLVYKTIDVLIPLISVKISNAGLETVSDENLSPLSLEEMFNYQQHITDKADFYARRLQDYILNHRAELPEISESKCNQMNAMLHSAASTSLWLGGRRGPKNNFRKCCKR